MYRPIALSCLALCLVAETAAAQAVRVEKNMSLELATQLAVTAVAACAAGGYAVTATVVDRAGQIRVVHRADNASPASLDSARKKAYTAVSLRNSTTAIMEAMQKNPGAANLWHIDGIIGLGGGLPVKVGNETIGGVGVGGAPAGHLDEQCAASAIDKAKDLLK